MKTKKKGQKRKKKKTNNRRINKSVHHAPHLINIGWYELQFKNLYLFYLLWY